MGTKLYQTLLESVLPTLPKRLRCLTREKGVTSRRFLETLGYRVLLTSYSPVLFVDVVDLAELARYHESLRRAGYSFCTLAKLRDPIRDRRITALCLEAYADTHVYRPPTASLDDWQTIFVGEGCLEDAFFVAKKESRYAAFSSLRKGDTDIAMEAM